MSHFTDEEQEKFNELFFQQEGKCACCGNKPEVRECTCCEDEYSLIPSYIYGTREFESLICPLCEFAIDRIIEFWQIPEELEEMCSEYLISRDCDEEDDA